MRRRKGGEKAEGEEEKEEEDDKEEEKERKKETRKKTKKRKNIFPEACGRETGDIVYLKCAMVKDRVYFIFEIQS